jgi:hypothetical protein
VSGFLVVSCLPYVFIHILHRAVKLLTPARLGLDYQIKIGHRVVDASDTPIDHLPYNLVGLDLIREFGLDVDQDVWRWKRAPDFL